jgi:hypothetical protein
MGEMENSGNLLVKKMRMKEKTRDFMGWRLNKYGMNLCSELKFNRVE